jgi:hypothetical protein
MICIVSHLFNPYIFLDLSSNVELFDSFHSIMPTGITRHKWSFRSRMLPSNGPRVYGNRIIS